jgi:hypothetical protein
MFGDDASKKHAFGLKVSNLLFLQRMLFQGM